VIPVDVTVPGCPPSPVAILQGSSRRPVKPSPRGQGH
jgi:Ni,Fe-hydrogenase III small subunit